MNKILIDGGSNEIVRPNEKDLWRDIIAGKRGTKRVEMKLASGKVDGGMTPIGEVMTVPGPPKEESEVRWIVPDDRLTRELGMRIVKHKGKVTMDPGPLKKPIEAVMINRLPYLTWEQFNPIREMLAKSHEYGRPSWHDDDKVRA